jgi:hypothetical protein
MAETPTTMKDLMDFMQQIQQSQEQLREELKGSQLDLQRDMLRYINETLEKVEDRLRMRNDKNIEEIMANLGTRSPTRGSRANSFGSRDGNEETENKRSAVLSQQESKPSEGDILGAQLGHLQESETSDGRTSMRSVTRNSGDRRPKNSIYRKNVAMGEDSSDIYTVQPTIKIPLFEHTLRSTQPGAILRFVREWVRYQTEYGVKVNPLTAVSESVLRKIRHTHNIDDATIRDATSKEFADYLALDLQMDNSFMFFIELQDALSYIPRLKWHGLALRDHEEFYNQLIFRQEKVLEYFSYFMLNNEHAVPRVSGKYGSAKLFLNLIDDEYNQPILAIMPDLKDNNYGKLQDFIKRYMDEATKQYKCTRAVINGVPFSSNRVKRTEQSEEKSSFQKKEYVRADDKKRDWTAKRFKPRQEQHVHKLEAAEREPVNDSDEEAWEQQWDEEIAQARKMYSDDDPLEKDCEEHEPEVIIPPDILHNIDPIMPTLAGQFDQQDRVHGCLYHTIYGKCLKGEKCKYASAHNARGAKETSEWIIKRLGSNDRQDAGAPKKMFSMKRN